MTRRHFVRTTTCSVLTGIAGLYGSRSHAAPADTIVLGFIGVGSMGTGTLQGFLGQPDVKVAAVCDVFEPHRSNALRLIGPQAAGYHDLRELLDRKDIDAVVISTPDHWHALATILACQAGKDVYCEKPLTRDLLEGRAVANMVNRHGRVFQMGTQIHGGENYHRVVDIMQSGILGKISTVRVWKLGGSPNLGWPADSDPPQGLDWDLWQGPAAWRPFNPARCPFNFRYFWDYAGGQLTDFGCHIIDVVHWAMNARGPTRVTATGRDNEGIADAPADLSATYEYPGGWTMHWSQTLPDVEGAAGHDPGAQFVGEHGTLVTDYGWHAVFPKELGIEAARVPRITERSPGHHRQWLDAIKTRRVWGSHIEYAHRLTSAVHLANISYRLHRPIRWDLDGEQVIGDEIANRMLLRPYRAPWRLVG